MMAVPNDGWGAVTLWGFSPALDFQEDCACPNTSEDGELEPLNILMVGAGDCRHILKTIAQRGRHKKRKIHIYVIENNLELIGRHMLLLTLALEPQTRMGLQEKSELFVELYGNTLIRQPTLSYLREKANLFVEMITDLDYADERMPCLDLSQLKHKERDFLETVFKYWNDPNQNNFPITNLWDQRLRQYLNLRYDSRSGAFDWDLTMKLHAFGATMITQPEYMMWREKGVAFSGREGCYDRVNKSMATRISRKMRNGEQSLFWGYWGDMVTGPFIGFGVEAHDKVLLKTMNGKPTRTSGDITLNNMVSIFSELATQEPYKGPENIDEVQDPKIMEVDEHEDQVQDRHFQNGKSGNREFYAPIPCEEVCVHFIPYSMFLKLHEKPKFQGLFNHGFISASMAVVLQRLPMNKLFAPGATLTLELVKYILDLNKNNQMNFMESVSVLASKAGFKPNPNPPPTAFSTTPATESCFGRFVFAEDHPDGSA